MGPYYNQVIANLHSVGHDQYQFTVAQLYFVQEQWQA